MYLRRACGTSGPSLCVIHSFSRERKHSLQRGRRPPPSGQTETSVTSRVRNDYVIKIETTGLTEGKESPYERP